MSLFAGHRYAVGRAFAMVRDRPVAFLLSVLLAGSALALPLALGSVLGAARPVLAQLQPSPEITIFVSPHATARDVEALKGRISVLPQVEAVALRTKDEALAQLLKRSGFSTPPSELGPNPLPDVLIARLRVPVAASDVDALSSQAKGWPLVDAVRNDLDWFRKVQAIASLGVTAAAVFGALVVILVTLILLGTTRLHAATRREEAVVLGLVGATTRFIVRPYAYSGAVTLAAASLLAFGAVYLTHAALRGPVAALTTLYGSAFSLPPPEPVHGVAVFLLSVVFGWVVGLLGARGAISGD